MKEYDIRLLKEHRKNFIGEQTLIDVWGEIHETKRFIGGLYYDSFKKTISNPGWTRGIKYTLEIDYHSLKIHCYYDQKYKMIEIPYEAIMKTIVNNKVLEMINGDNNIIIRLKQWDNKIIQDFNWYLTWMNKAQKQGVKFDDEKEIKERNQRIRKNRIKQVKKIENTDFIISIIFILFIIGIIITIINQFIGK
jgi:hypothetical protein